MTPLLDRLIVKVREWDRADDVVREVGGRIVQRMRPIRWVVVEIDHARASDLFAAYAAHPDVEDVTIDEEARPHAVETYHHVGASPVAIGQWQLKHMNVFAAWKYARGAGVRIAICDTGMALAVRSQPWYTARDVAHWNSVYDSVTHTWIDDGEFEHVDEDVTQNTDPSNRNHGAMAMGAASMVAPEADLANIRITGVNGLATSAGLAAACLDAWDLFGCAAINGSWGFSKVTAGTPETTLNSDTVWRDTFAYLNSPAVVCLSAGNDGSGSVSDAGGTGPGIYMPAFAAGWAGHFGVAALAADHERPVDYSCFGAELNAAAGTRAWVPYGLSHVIPPQTTTIDLTGWPYGQKPGTPYVADFRTFDGTSCSAPVMAGVVALVKSAYLGLTGLQVRDIILETGYVGEHPEFALRLPTARVPDALRAVLKAKSLDPANAGQVYPYLSFRGRGVRVDVDPTTLAPTTHLGGLLRIVVGAYSSDPITSVAMYAGTDLIYSGAPLSWDNPLRVSADVLAGKTLKVVGATASGPTEIEYSDVTAHASGGLCPPVTRASPPSGQPPPGTNITLTVASELLPVRTQYRWDAGPWQTYTGPFPAQAGTLEFYSVDCNGNIEGGIDHALL